MIPYSSHPSNLMRVTVPIIHRLAPSPCSSQAPLDHLQQMLVLQSRLHPLLVVELLVDRVLGLMCAFFDADVYAESWG